MKHVHGWKVGRKDRTVASLRELAGDAACAQYRRRIIGIRWVHPHIWRAWADLHVRCIPGGRVRVLFPAVDAASAFHQAQPVNQLEQQFPGDDGKLRSGGSGTTQRSWRAKCSECSFDLHSVVRALRPERGDCCCCSSGSGSGPSASCQAVLGSNRAGETARLP